MSVRDAQQGEMIRMFSQFWLFYVYFTSSTNRIIKVCKECVGKIILLLSLGVTLKILLKYDWKSIYLWIQLCEKNTWSKDLALLLGNNA